MCRMGDGSATSGQGQKIGSIFFPKKLDKGTRPLYDKGRQHREREGNKKRGNPLIFLLIFVDFCGILCVFVYVFYLAERLRQESS